MMQRYVAEGDADAYLLGSYETRASCDESAAALNSTFAIASSVRAGALLCILALLLFVVAVARGLAPLPKDQWMFLVFGATLTGFGLSIVAAIRAHGKQADVRSAGRNTIASREGHESLGPLALLLSLSIAAAFLILGNVRSVETVLRFSAALPEGLSPAALAICALCLAVPFVFFGLLLFELRTEPYRALLDRAAFDPPADFYAPLAGEALLPYRRARLFGFEPSSAFSGIVIALPLITPGGEGAVLSAAFVAAAAAFFFALGTSRRFILPALMLAIGLGVSVPCIPSATGPTAAMHDAARNIDSNGAPRLELPTKL